MLRILLTLFLVGASRGDPTGFWLYKYNCEGLSAGGELVGYMGTSDVNLCKERAKTLGGNAINFRGHQCWIKRVDLLRQQFGSGNGGWDIYLKDSLPCTPEQSGLAGSLVDLSIFHLSPTVLSPSGSLLHPWADSVASLLLEFLGNNTIYDNTIDLEYVINIVPRTININTEGEFLSLFQGCPNRNDILEWTNEDRTNVAYHLVNEAQHLALRINDLSFNNGTVNLEEYMQRVSIHLYIYRILLIVNRKDKVAFCNAYTNMTTNAMKYYQYAMFVIGKKSENEDTIRQSQRVLEYWMPSVQPWLDLAQGQVDAMDNTVLLRAGDNVAFKRQNDQWFSCWMSGTVCNLNPCPANGVPFNKSPGSRTRYQFDCRGEVFWIYSPQRNIGEPIEVCDTVRILYSCRDGRCYWAECANGVVKTKNCGPGLGGGGACGETTFQIMVSGKNCGEIIKDRELVILKFSDQYVSIHDGRCTCNTNSDQSFAEWQIYKQGSPFRGTTFYRYN